MSEVLIEAHGLGKKYHRGYFAKRFGRGKGSDEFWALKDIDLELREGESLGIIGPNGAGKSTLLKILSRVTTPTEGWLRVRGRVGALIELGAGFHPELSGRDNIFIAGSILGMSRREIARRFEEIVDFAELEEFINMPIKKYSSGMSVRLGFAVAAFMDPDILLVDEVLAVGDTVFRSKCMRVMEGYREAGLGLILVTHNLHAVVSHCQRAILLDHGSKIFEGSAVAACQRYLENMVQRCSLREEQYVPGASFGSLEVEIVGVAFKDREGCARSEFEAGEPCQIELSYLNRAGRECVSAEVTIHDRQDREVFSTHAVWDGGPLRVGPARGVLTLDIGGLYLPAGEYLITVGIHDPRATVIYHVRYKAHRLRVISSRPTFGCAYLPHEWRTDVATVLEGPTEAAP